MYKVSKKRIVLALMPLIVINAVILAEFFLFERTAWSEEKKTYDENDRVYTNQQTTEVRSGDQVLVRYEGSDGDCYKMKKDSPEREKCLAEHPYGGQGTLSVGGNMVVENAQGIYLNGADSAGYAWIMSSSSEPYGNTMAVRQEKNSNIYYGNHLLADGTISTGGVAFRHSDISVLFNQRSEYMTNDGVFEMVGKLVFAAKRFGNSPDVFSVLEKGVCGVCGETCSDGKVGKDYQFIAKNGLEVKTTLKVNQQIRLCGWVKECEMACCREALYLEDDTYDNFVGANCSDTPCVFEPKDPYGLGPTYCYPQPYLDWTYVEKLPLEVSYHEAEGYRVRGGTGVPAAYWTSQPANNKGSAGE